MAAIVFVTAQLLASGPARAQDSLMDARMPLLMGIVLGVLAFAIVVAMGAAWGVRRARSRAERAEAGAGALSRELDFYQSLLISEPQALLYWQGEEPPRLVTATLPPKLGVPREAGALMSFAAWLERDAAQELERRMEALRTAGTSFNVMLRTAAGAYIEADGRAAGGGGTLKIRDLAERRQEMIQVLEQHKRLTHEIALMRALLDALPSPAWLRSPSGQIEWCNKAYARAVEAAGTDDVRSQQIELLEARDRAAAEQTLAKGEPFRQRIHTIVAGERRAFEAVIVPVGQASAGLAIDSAALETAESELNRHIEAHVRTLDRITMAVAVFSPEQRLSYHNQAFQDLWQLDPAWLATHPRNGEILDRLREARKLPEQADYRAWKERHLAVYTSPGPRDEWWHLPDGRSIHVLADQGPDGGVTFLYEDATARLQLESRYNALIHVQKETLDHLREGVAVFASDGRLKLFNPAFAAIWKLSREELEKEPHIEEVVRNCRVLLDDDEAWEQVKSAVTGIDDQRRPIEGELSRPDGSELHYAGLPLPDGATLLTYVDVTDTKRMERALIERNEALEAADKLKNAFISHVSYELRAPLTSIIGFSELLSQPATGPLSPKQQEYVRDIRASSDALLAIINDILDLATIDAGAVELTLSPVRVREVIEQAVLGVRDRLRQAELRLAVRVDDDVTEFIADGRRVTQVLFNLLSNAIGFSNPGSEIRLTCRRENGMIAFSVRDFGVGIPNDYQRVVFDRFESRAQGARHRGAGLGLAIVKSLVELHGGDVSLASVEGKGTKVTVRFPLDRSRAARPGDAHGATGTRRYPPAAE